MKKPFLILSLILGLSSFAQDGCGLRISLLTCAPGAELYSTFGHTAIRVRNAATGADEVYNYGTFEFDDDFYAKFVRGKLLYALSVESFADFLYQYQAESRSVVEQTLSLTCAQKQTLYNALQQNAQPQNRAYRYDFLFDNCTTRARDMVKRKSGGAVVFKNGLPAKPPTFRDAIDVYLLRAKQHWSKLGIDLLLGAKMDRPMTAEEAMFLPDNLMAGFDAATVDGRPLVEEKQSVLAMPSVTGEPLAVTPVVGFGLLLVVVAALSLVKRGWAAKALQVFDFLYFFALGLVGCLLVFMWTGTDHALCANNWNLLWAVPTHLVAAFFVHKEKGWAPRYFTAVFWLTVALLIAWAFLPQRMNPGFLPLVLLVALRSYALSKPKKNGTKND